VGNEAIFDGCHNRRDPLRDRKLVSKPGVNSLRAPSWNSVMRSPCVARATMEGRLFRYGQRPQGADHRRAESHQKVTSTIRSVLSKERDRRSGMRALHARMAVLEVNLANRPKAGVADF
jgi:hypothetical protein